MASLMAGIGAATAPTHDGGASVTDVRAPTRYIRQLQAENMVSSVSQLIEALDNVSIRHIVLATGDYPITSTLSINRNVTIEAAVPGEVTVNGQDSTQVFEITAGVVELIGLGITKGQAQGNCNSGEQGGGVTVSGSSTRLHFQHCNIYNNTANCAGGGIDVRGSNNEVVLTMCNIFKNTALNGGGLAIRGTGTSLSMHACKLFLNEANVKKYGYGGALYLGVGFGIQLNTAITLTGCSIYDNAAAIGGGGAIDSGYATLVGTHIFRNHATNGGGYYAFGGANVALTECTVHGNDAQLGGGSTSPTMKRW